MKTTNDWIGILAFALLATTASSSGYAQATGAQATGKSPLNGAQVRAELPRGAPAATSKDARPDSTSEPDGAKGPAYDKIEAEREKIWNSPEMLSARAWLETYFERAAKISDEQAKKYMDGLRTMYPDQMKLWLVKFQADRESRKQQHESQRQVRNQTLAARQASPQVGGFQNPYAGRRATSSGQPIGNVRQSYGGGANPVAQHQPVQKPFAGQSVRGPLVTSEDVARWEILRGLGWGGGRGY
jgi:hypothetical protein